MALLQLEITRLREDEQNRASFSNNMNSTTADHLTTYTNRQNKQAEKIIQGRKNTTTPIAVNYNSKQSFPKHKKAMSTSNNFRKLKNDIQLNLLKGYIKGKGYPDSKDSLLELSNRTPDKPVAEVSPYMMDFYKNKRSMLDDKYVEKVRLSGSNIRYTKKGSTCATHDSEQSPERENMITSHKKSKSQTSIAGIRSMDHRASQSHLPIAERAEVSYNLLYLDTKIKNSLLLILNLDREENVH